MASKFIGVLSILALAGSCMAGIASYAYNPYASSAAVTYASHTPVYHHQPIVYQQTAPLITKTVLPAAPVFAKTAYLAPASYVKTSPLAAPVVKSYGVAPVATVQTVSPVVTKTVVSSAPAPAIATVPVLKNVEYAAAPRYDFSYGVHDSITGDIKHQVETRSGGNVAGSYSVVDADGFKRTVTYTADDVNGFNAVVQREPIVAKLTPVAAAPAIPVQHIQHLPVQQNLQYLPQAPVQQQTVEVQPVQEEFVSAQPQQELEVQQPVEVPQQPEAEPAPIEYPEQQQQQEQLQEIKEEEQPQYPEDQQFPPYPQYEIPQSEPTNDSNQPENDDSDVVELRTAKDNGSSTAAPAPVTEDQKDDEPQGKPQ
ncbi:cuticle protein [Teleopsis dalmanni]|uniref:cuticle protein n=1 Tax=Teleopsis dalmanni TaxID=139649 RepID=UPI0018CD176A|nr:cuticle protein [Teleopsis dalmanni]